MQFPPNIDSQTSRLTTWVLIAIAALYTLYVIAVSNDLTGSMWYDEVHVAELVSRSSYYDIVFFDFRESLGRQTGYLLISKLLSTIYNAEFSFRALQLFGVLTSFIICVSIGRITNSPSCALLLFAVVIFSNEYIQHGAMFKPYVLDVAATLFYIRIMIGRGVQGLSLDDFLPVLVTSSLIATISLMAWVGTLSLGMTWFADRLKKREIFQDFSNAFRSARSIGIMLCLVLIWAFLFQWVLRSIVHGANSGFYEYVAREGVEETGIANALWAYLKTLFEIVRTFGVVDVSPDMPFFFLSGSRATILTLIIIIGTLLGTFCFLRHQLVHFVIVFLGSTIFMAAVANWPFDAERWSLGLFPIVIAPFVLLLARISNRRPGLGLLLILPIVVLQAPLKSHPNGLTFHSKQYWTSRGQPTTNSRELISFLDKYSPTKIDAIVTNRNTGIFISYYNNFYQPEDFSILRSTKLVQFRDPDSLVWQVEKNIAGLKRVAYVQMHSFRQYDDIVAKLSGICSPLEEIRDKLNGSRLLRARAFIFDCS